MTDNLTTIAVAAIASVPPTLMALAGWRKGRQNHREVKATKAEVTETKDAVQSIYVKLDGRLTKFMKISRREARLAGYEAGVRNRRIRRDDQTRATKARQLAELKLKPLLKPAKKKKP